MFLDRALMSDLIRARQVVLELAWVVRILASGFLFVSSDFCSSPNFGHVVICDALQSATVKARSFGQMELPLQFDQSRMHLNGSKSSLIRRQLGRHWF